MKSIFTEGNIEPTTEALKRALAETLSFWQDLESYTTLCDSSARGKWQFSKTYGWSFRISDEKRVLIYLLPRDRFFKAAFVFGQKATDSILKSAISTDIKNELENAKPYAEGRGIRIEVRDASNLDDLKALIKVKTSI